MGAQNGVIQVERRALRIQGTGATVAGTTNTNVVAFTGAAVAFQMTINGVPGTSTYPIGTTYVAPLENSGNWINTVNSVTAGTGFKFNRKGVYFVSLKADGDATLAATAGAQLGITLDQAAGLDTVAAGTVTALSDTVLDYCVTDAIANAGVPVVTAQYVYITDRLAGGAQPSADLTTTRGVGVMRFIANNNANAVIGAALTVASIRATIVMSNEISGT